MAFSSCTDFLPRPVLSIKKLIIQKTNFIFSYQYSKLNTRWPYLSQIPPFSLVKLLREGNQIWYTCDSTTFGNIRVIHYTKLFFHGGWWGVELLASQNTIMKQKFAPCKVQRAGSDSIQTARSNRPFYRVKLHFFLPWLQNRLQRIAYKNFSMHLKNL